LLDEAFPGSEVKYEDKKVIFKLSDEEARIDLSKAPFYIESSNEVLQ